MSWVALAWASQQRLERASDKLILLAYAECQNQETGYAYPSIKWLCEFSSLNRKTVISCVDRLESIGHLSDTGRRVGATKQVKVYTVNVGEIRTVPKTGQSNSPDISGEESQKRDTEPPIKPQSKSISFPDDWKASEADREYAKSKGLTPEETNRCEEDFRDYFRADGKRKSTDWSLNWQRWCRVAADELPRKRQRQTGQPNSARNGSKPVGMAGIVARRRREASGELPLSADGWILPRD